MDERVSEWEEEDMWMVTHRPPSRRNTFGSPDIDKLTWGGSDDDKRQP